MAASSSGASLLLSSTIHHAFPPPRQPLCAPPTTSGSCAGGGRDRALGHQLRRSGRRPATHRSPCAVVGPHRQHPSAPGGSWNGVAPATCKDRQTGRRQRHGLHQCPNRLVAGIWLPAWTNAVAWRRTTTWSSDKCGRIATLPRPWGGGGGRNCMACKGSRLGSALPCPAGRSVPGPRRTGPPEASATGRDRNPDAHEIAHGTRRDTPGCASTGRDDALVSAQREGLVQAKRGPASTPRAQFRSRLAATAHPMAEPQRRPR
jgi:hypothetical protein